MGITEMITIVVTAALTVVTGGFLRYIAKAIKDVRKAFVLIQDAQRASMRDQIVFRHDHFMKQQAIGKYSLSSLEDMFDKYTKLGGNEFVHSMMDDVRNLPIK